MMYRCKYCKKKVEKLQIKIPQVCKECVLTHFESNKEKVINKAKKEVEKNRKKECAKAKESLKSISAVINDVKKVFQHFIRLRDRDLPCISCGANKCDEWAGGHFFKAEIYSGLIFDERNCHKQCNAKCNKYAQGAQLEYRMGLVNRYGEDFVNQLEQDSLNLKQYKYTREELKEIKEKYKQKIKDYETATN